MSEFIIEGGHRLSGEIIPQGAKNEALQVLSAVLLTDQPVTIANLPDIRDTQRYRDILSLLGVKITKINKDTFTFQADNVDLDMLTTKEFVALSASIRASIMVLGPLLGRFHKAYAARPGGDPIGPRAWTTPVAGFGQMGGTV